MLFLRYNIFIITKPNCLKLTRLNSYRFIPMQRPRSGYRKPKRNYMPLWADDRMRTLLGTSFCSLETGWDWAPSQPAGYTGGSSGGGPARRPDWPSRIFLPWLSLRYDVITAFIYVCKNHSDVYLTISAVWHCCWFLFFLYGQYMHLFSYHVIFTMYPICPSVAICMSRYLLIANTSHVSHF